MTMQHKPDAYADLAQRFRDTIQQLEEIWTELSARTPNALDAAVGADPDLAGLAELKTAELRPAPDSPRRLLPFARPEAASAATGVRRYDGADEAEAMMRADPDPPVVLPGATARLLDKALNAARRRLEPRTFSGPYREMCADREAVGLIEVARDLLIEAAANAPASTPHATKGD